MNAFMGINIMHMIFMTAEHFKYFEYQINDLLSMHSGINPIFSIDHIGIHNIVSRVIKMLTG